MNCLTTLVSGASAAAREAAIRAELARSAMQDTVAVLLEGLASGQDAFDGSGLPALQVVRIAPGCVCCSGNLTMRVTLNRLLRQRPARLYISLADSRHLERIEAFLTAPPYVEWLTLAPTLRCDAPA